MNNLAHDYMALKYQTAVRGADAHITCRASCGGVGHGRCCCKPPGPAAPLRQQQLVTSYGQVL